MIRKIFLDLDDVLNLFTLHALRFFDCPLAADDYYYAGYPDDVGFDFPAAVNRLSPRPEMPANEIWDALPRLVWATAPKSPEADFLIANSFDLVGPENTFVLTAPTKCPDCLAGKLEWIHDFLPTQLHRQFVITPRKHLCAADDALLIDDAMHNCQAFAEAGGRVAVCPRPWNVLAGHSPREALTAFFNAFRKEQKR